MSKKIKKILIIAICFVMIFIFCYYENHHLVTSNYTYSSDKLSKDFDGFRIVQISDLHNGNFGKKNQTLVKKIQEANPDIIVITGDFVDSNHTDINANIDFARQLTSRYPVYYVTGNHEYWLDDNQFSKLMNGLKEAGAVILLDEVVKISKNDSNFNLIGLDDNSLVNGTLNDLLEKNKSDDLNILLAHEPQNFKFYERAGADLCLTGHAHGGQFRLPFIKSFNGIVAPDQGFFPKYTSGVHFYNDMEMIISRGLGNSVIPVRLFNDPEIVVVELQAD